MDSLQLSKQVWRIVLGKEQMVDRRGNPDELLAKDN